MEPLTLSIIFGVDLKQEVKCVKTKLFGHIADETRQSERRESGYLFMFLREREKYA